MTKPQINALGFTLGIIALVLGIRLHIIDALAFFTPYYDDWGMGGTLQEHKSNELTLTFLLSPNNGHLGFWREMLQITIFDINQSQWDTYLQMVVNAVIWTVNAVFLITIVRRHFTSVSAPIAIVFVILLWIFPFSLINATWGVQTHNYNMILFSMVAIWFVQNDAYTKGWWFGLLMTFMVPLTMGAGGIVAPALLGLIVIKIAVDRRCWPSIKPTFVALILLSVYSVWVLKQSSSGHEVYYARNLVDFLTTFSKSLSFPILGQIWAAPIMLSPMIILGVQAMRFNALHDKAISFTIVLSAYTIGIALATGYARGFMGGDPSDRYFEFFQMYLLASVLSLLLLQSKQVKMGRIANLLLIVVWVYTVFLGALDQTSFLNNKVEERAIAKPKQDDIFKKYMATRDMDVFGAVQVKHLPFPSGPGLVFFINKVEQENIMSYKMQTPGPLTANGTVTGFVTNGTIAPRKDNWQYQYGYESAIGSFDRANGGANAEGKFISTAMKFRQDYLMIPVSGYLAEEGLSLTLVDLKTGEETPVRGPQVDNISAEEWHEVFVKTPDNEFQIVAQDSSSDHWFAFAAPRSVGRLSMLSAWMISNGKHLWKLGILMLLLSLRDPLLNFLRPKSAAV